MPPGISRVIPLEIRLLVLSRIPFKIPAEISGLPKGIPPGITPSVHSGYSTEISYSTMPALCRHFL